jgi:hypothetical protein
MLNKVDNGHTNYLCLQLLQFITIVYITRHLGSVSFAVNSSDTGHKVNKAPDV